MISCFVIQSREYVTLWSVSTSRSFLNNYERYEGDMTGDSSDFASCDSDKSDWDALKGCISNPSKVDFNEDIIADVSGHAVVVDSN
jgi:hypothetical protein